MDRFSCPTPVLVDDSSLDAWTKIGSGGFGQIYKSRHKRLCCDVAIKLLHNDDGSGSSLYRELDMMRQGSSPYVIHVIGLFRGICPTGSGTRIGLVMEFMERGCLATLQECLCEAPPWPLVFRLAHQIALGINFLHSLPLPLLHLDLKPSNVLLDSSLNAKLTDFGLAKVYQSVSRVSILDNAAEEGTLSYMPPEALDDLSYTPTKASDIYSYGILLWSIITGKQPYKHALSRVIRVLVPQGDRPSVEAIRAQARGINGLTKLQELMEQCWAGIRDERPSSYDCSLKTEELFKLHKHNINAAVHHVQNKLDQAQTEQVTNQFQDLELTRTESTVNGCLDVKTGKGPVQEVAEHSSAEVKAHSMSSPVRESDAKLNSSDPGPKLKPSSVKPIEPSAPSTSSSSPSSSSSSSSSRSANQKTSKKSSPAAPEQEKFQQCQRQNSSPASHVRINCSNITGLQVGNNNVMHIQTVHQRRRHPTAPSKVDLRKTRKPGEEDMKRL